MVDGRDYFRATIDTSQFDRDARHIQNTFSNIGSVAEAEGARIDASLKIVGTTIAGIFTFNKVSQFAKDVANIRGEFQQLEIAFETMLGSKAKSDALMSQLIDTAAKTPFDLTGVANGAKQLLAYGTASDKVNETLIRLGDVASGLSIPLNDLVYLYGTTQVQGRLFTKDIQQFLGRGIPIVKELSKELNVTEESVNELVSAGKIGFDDLQKVIENLTSEGGMFFNLMEKQSASITGQIANLEDAWDVMLNNIGTNSEETFTSAIDIATILVENYETVGKSIAGLIVMYGTYRAAVVAVNVVQKINASINAMVAASSGVFTKSLAAQWLMTESLQKAQARLNSTMLANPYVLATMAVVALGYATYKVVTYQNKLQEATSDLNTSVFKEKELLSSLVTNLNATKKGSEEYNSIKKELNSKYGESLKSINLEIDALYRNKENYELLTKEIEKNTRAKLKNKYIEQFSEKSADKVAESYNNIFKKIKSQVKGVDSGSVFGDIRSFIEESTINTSGHEFDKLFKKHNLKWSDYSKDVFSLLSSRYNLKKDLEELDLVFGDSLLTADSNDSNPTQEIKNLAEQTEIARKKVLDLKKELSDLRTGKTASDNYAQAIEDKAKELKDAENKLNLLLYGKSTSDLDKGESASEKARKQAQELKKAKDKQALQEIRAAEDLEIQINEAEINAMDEGSEKVLAQMDLNYKKQKQALERQKEDALRTKVDNARSVFEADPQNKGKTFDESAIKLTEEELKKVQDLQVKLTANFEKDKYSLELQYMRDYISEYGTFQQKKLLIAQEYDKKIAASHNEWEKKSLEAQKQGEISNIDFEAISKRIDWQGVFGDMTGMLDSQLKETLSGLKEYVKTDQFKLSSDTDKKTIYEAIERLNSVMSEGQGTLNFAKIQRQMDDLGAAINRLQIATLNEKKASDNLAKAQKEYDNALKTGNQTIIEGAKQALKVAKTSASETSSAYKSAESDVENLGNSFRETAVDTVDGLNSVADGLNNFASNSLPAIFKGLQDTLSGLSKLNIPGKIGEVIGTLSKTLSSAGFIGQIISAVLSILDILKDGIGPLISGIIDTVLNAVDGILKNLLSGELFVQIFNSLKNGIANILNTISFGGFNKLTYAISGSNAKETAETISRLTSSNEALKVSVDALREEIAGTNGAKSIQAYNEAVNAQQRYNENLSQILDAQMGYHSAHHSNSYYWNLNKNSLNEVNQLLGTSLKNTWGDFSKLTADQMNEIRKHLPDVWSEMINQGKYGDRFKDDWNNYADQAGKVVEMTEALRENIAQISFDSLRDSFVNALMDMDSDAKDFAGNFEEYLTKALLNFAIGDLLDDQMKKWYESWADTINKQDGKLTDAQIAQYKKEWDAMVQMGIDKRDEIAALTGYTGNESDRQATAKGVATASQESVNEYLGVLYGVRQIQGDIRNINIDLRENSTKLNEMVLDMRAVVNDNNQILQDSLDYQSQIAANTFRTAELLDAIETYGLKLKQ